MPATRRASSPGRSGSDRKIAADAGDERGDAGGEDRLERGIEVVARRRGGDRVGQLGAWIAGRTVDGHGSDSCGLAGALGARIVHRPNRDGIALTRPGPAPILPPMKLVVAIVHNEDAGALVDALLEKEFRATRLHSSGGFLKQSNATVLLGVEDAEVDEVVAIVRENCTSRTQVVNPMPPIMEPGEFFMPYPLEVEVGGATVFVVPVERFERL